MVHYKLTYFDFCGLGEVARQLFVLSGQEFDDNRIKPQDWLKIKDTMLFGQMPVLEEDGKELAQSSAINRYLAKKFGFAGNSSWEEAEIDSIADQFKDFFMEIRQYLRASRGRPGAGDDPVALFNELVIPATKKHFPFFTEFLKNSNTGFLVGRSVTWVDLLVAEFLCPFQKSNPELFEQFPEIVSHIEKIHSIPAISKWRAERPHSEF